MSKINNDWKEILEEEFQKDYFVELKNILEKEYENYTVYPPKKRYSKCFFSYSLFRSKSCTFRTRSLSSERSGTWFSFSVNYGIKDTTITFKYVQRIT